MSRFERTHGCGELREEDAGRSVVLAGWVAAHRDMGGIIFLDLRDRSGVVQVVVHPEQGDAFRAAEQARGEHVLQVWGTVVRRPPELANTKLATGWVEVSAERIRLLNPSKTPPFYIEEGVDADEMVRLRHRYLDLRRPDMQRNLMLRHRVTLATRNFLDGHGFVEIETPMLTRSTPEGARDFLVPSRLQRGHFYALPQSPQLFKQLLMVAGMERYFQIVRCFRDEDLRADRQPEFTQIDVELSFVGRDDVLDLMERLVVRIFQEALGVEVKAPFPRLTYAEAMERYGSDKPDLRFDMAFEDIGDIAAGCGFSVFRTAVESGGRVKGINARGCGGYSRKQIDELAEMVKGHGAKGLAHIALGEGGEVRSSFTKFLSDDETQAIIRRLAGRPGDLLLFVADRPEVVAASLGALRLEMGNRLGLRDPKDFRLLWVVDFPLLEWDEEENRFVAVHHPFTAPHPDDLAAIFEQGAGRQALATIRANAYDLVLNGVEVGGGSIRIHERRLQNRMFELLGFSEEEARSKFGFLLDAFDYGAPPHGGIAFGLDRLAMLLAGRASIREVIAFPKTAQGTDPLTDAPSEVSPAQLRELGLVPFDTLPLTDGVLRDGRQAETWQRHG